MPTIDCALGTAPLDEVEDKKSGFIVALLIIWIFVRSALRTRRKPGKRKEDPEGPGSIEQTSLH